MSRWFKELNPRPTAAGTLPKPDLSGIVSGHRTGQTLPPSFKARATGATAQTPAQATPALPDAPALQAKPAPPPNAAFRNPHLRDVDWKIQESSPIRRFAVYFVLVLILLRFGLINELLAIAIGARAFLGFVVTPPALLGAILTGVLWRSLRLAPSRFWLAMLFWITISAPFSIWRGGSFQVLKGAYLTEFSTFFMIAGTILTLQDVRRAMMLIAFGGIIDTVAAKVWGGFVGSRLAFTEGTFSNPNDLAMHVLITVPFMTVMILNSRSTSLWRLGGPLAIGGAIYVGLATGSRGGFLAICAMLLFAFWRGSMKQRALLAMACCGLTVIAVVALPSQTWRRYTSLWQKLDPESNEDMEAIGSKMARQELLKKSIIVTLQNPLFGVGAGQFQVAENDLAKAEGRKGGWHVTHNTYTEASSEAGIPALIFLLGAIWGSMWHLNRVYRESRKFRQLQPITNMALGFMMTLVLFSICILFSSQTYRFVLPSLVALSVAFVNASWRELALVRSMVAK